MRRYAVNNVFRQFFKVICKTIGKKVMYKQNLLQIIICSRNAFFFQKNELMAFCEKRGRKWSVLSNQTKTTTITVTKMSNKKLFVQLIDGSFFFFLHVSYKMDFGWQTVISGKEKEENIQVVELNLQKFASILLIGWCTEYQPMKILNHAIKGREEWRKVANHQV